MAGARRSVVPIALIAISLAALAMLQSRWIGDPIHLKRLRGTSATKRLMSRSASIRGSGGQWRSGHPGHGDREFVGNGLKYGIALSLVREAVESHGGRVQVLSAAHRGTTLTLQLPPLRPSVVPALGAALAT